MESNRKKHPKNVLITIRVTQEERTKLHTLAKEKGYGNISEAIRALVAPSVQNQGSVNG
jgi:hypothetical protein